MQANTTSSYWIEVTEPETAPYQNLIKTPAIEEHRRSAVPHLRVYTWQAPVFFRRKMNTLFFFVLIFLGGPLDSLSLNPAEKPSKNFGILYALFSDLALVLRQSFVSTFPDATGLTNGAVWPLQAGISDSSSSREGCVAPRESEQMTQQMVCVCVFKWC